MIIIINSLSLSYYFLNKKNFNFFYQAYSSSLASVGDMLIRAVPVTVLSFPDTAKGSILCL